MLAGALEAELLAFFFAGVAAEQIGALQGALVVFVDDNQSFGDTEADCFDLAFVATAGDVGTDVELASDFESL